MIKLKYIVTGIAVFLFIFRFEPLQAQDSILSNFAASDDSNYRKEVVFSTVYMSASYLGWINLPDNVTLKNQNSCNYSVFTVINFFKNTKHFNMASGITLSVNTFQNNVGKWDFDSSGNIKNSNLITSSYKKNKTVVGYFGIPLEIKYKFGFNPKRAINTGIGARFGFLINPHTILETEDVKTITKIKSNFNKISYGLYGYAGYRHLAVFAQYQLSNIFDNSFAPDCKNWSLGLALML